MATSTLPETSAFAPATGPMVLRVRGPGRPKQVIKLHAPKCTVGSGRECTLRLRARGVAAVHCLIVRGKMRTVVRRFRGDTRLNDADFSDTELRPGDRLAIGPVELEVLRTGSEPADRSAWGDVGETSTAAAPSGERRASEDPSPRTDHPARSGTADTVERLDRANRHNRRRLRQIIARTRQLKQRLLRMDERRRLAEQSEQEASAQLATARAEIATVRAEIESSRSDVGATREELEAAREQVESERAELQRREAEVERRQAQLDAQAHELEQREGAVRQRREELSDRQADWRDQQQQFQQKQDEIQRREDELRRQWEQIEQDRCEIARLREEHEQALKHERQELVDARADIERQQVELEQQRESELQERLAAEQSQETSAELDAAPADFDAERVQWQGQVDQLRREMELVQEGLSHERAGWQREREQLQRNLVERADELDARQREVDRQADELDELRGEVARLREEIEQLREAAAQRELSVGDEDDSAALDGPEHGIADAQPQRSTPAEDDESAEQDTSSELASILERMGRTDLLRDDDDSDDGDSGDDGQPSPFPAGEAAAPNRADATGGAPADSSSAGSSDADDESVDEYMADLLRRVRGESEGASQPADAATQSKREKVKRPVPYESVVADEQSIDATASERSEPSKRSRASLAPRARAPEDMAGLTAMRELANSTARTAVDRHARQVLEQAQKSKLLVAFVGAAMGAALFWMWSGKDGQPLTYYAALVSLLIAGLWLVQYAILTGRLIVSKSGHLDVQRGAEQPSKSQAEFEQLAGGVGQRDESEPGDQGDKGEVAPSQADNPLSK